MNKIFIMGTYEKILSIINFRKTIFIEDVKGNQSSPSIQKLLSKSQQLIKRLITEKGAKFSITDDDKLLFQMGQTLIEIEHEEELYIANEIFNDCTYGFLVSDDITVIDIGSNIGVSLLYYNQFDNIRNIIGFEPVPITFDRLKRNLSINGNPSKITINNFGLGNCNRTDTFLFSDEYKGSVGVVGLKDSPKKSGSLSSVKVSIRDCKEIFDEIFSADVKSENRLLLKIDCEGGEYEIIPHMYNLGYLDHFDFVVMEWHGNRYAELFEYFTSFNCFYYKNSPSTGMLYALKRSLN
jgi:FkbM family methyltransferase